jgi:spore maturation protein CgeB
MDSINPAHRDIGVLFVGSRKGYRDLWCAYLADAGIPLYRKFTDQSLAHSVATDDYIELLKRARVIFNCGLVSSRESSPNFRVFEGLCSGGALLQNDFELMRSYFTPYVHYAPYTNAHEMVSTAQFLLKHDEIADEIAGRGFAWYREHYAGPSFWREVEQALW